MPEIKQVKFFLNDDPITKGAALGYREIGIRVNDGIDTPLTAKGDGIQSLVALGIRRHTNLESRYNRNFIFAIEEPEAHLHPSAVHELKKVIFDISKIDQVIVTTHNPIFSNKTDFKKNIIISEGKALPARDLAEIREALGVKISDNLVNADLVLFVEGEWDKKIIQSILKNRDKNLQKCLENGSLLVRPLNGVTKLSQSIQHWTPLLSHIHCFLDHDAAAIEAVESAFRVGLDKDRDCHFSLVGNLKETEIEDMIDVSIYAEEFKHNFHIDISGNKLKGEKKWSDRVKDLFQKSGKSFDDTTLLKAKRCLALAVESDPSSALLDSANNIIESLTDALIQKLKSLSAY